MEQGQIDQNTNLFTLGHLFISTSASPKYHKSCKHVAVKFHGGIDFFCVFIIDSHLLADPSKPMAGLQTL